MGQALAKRENKENEYAKAYLSSSGVLNGVLFVAEAVACLHVDTLCE